MIDPQAGRNAALPMSSTARPTPTTTGAWATRNTTDDNVLAAARTSSTTLRFTLSASQPNIGPATRITAVEASITRPISAGVIPKYVLAITGKRPSMPAVRPYRNPSPLRPNTRRPTDRSTGDPDVSGPPTARWFGAGSNAGDAGPLATGASPMPCGRPRTTATSGSTESTKPTANTRG